MTRLESIILTTAHGFLAEILLHYMMVKDRIISPEDQSEEDLRDFYIAKGGFMALVALARNSDSGMSADAVNAILVLERQEIAATPATDD
ncbi:hypothetical protein [Pseudomonas sp. P9(2020)]|uniref:hypothetical protein n=1 Tax=Pseudomonas sp. P9(2020) TaxID=2763316 RepID=UPI001B324872|nr:hypothetical protein [Pseudomonas sp. P9(2020)]MBP5947884.1 hypothetical protein [Pseudomonas sp. P9(2020)]